jgi:hypothetical protein
MSILKLIVAFLDSAVGLVKSNDDHYNLHDQEREVTLLQGSRTEGWIANCKF